MKDIASNPTIYPYCLTDLDGKDYADTLNSVFHDPVFIQRMQSRNNLYQSLGRMTKQQVNTATKQLILMDQTIAKQILTALVLRSIQVNHLEQIPFNSLLSNVDLSDDDKRKARQRLATSLDMVTFLADVLESKTRDIDEDLSTLFGKDVEFKQFDGVTAAIRNMMAFFSATRDNGSHEARALFAEYAESIENYLDKRIETFMKKYRKIAGKKVE